MTARALCAVAAAGLFTGCSTAVTPEAGSALVVGKIYDISCDEAHRVAAKTLKVRGMHLTSVDRGASGGAVAGTDGKQSIEVRLSCAPQGVTVGSSGGTWTEQGVQMSFASLVGQGDRIWPPPKGPKIKVEALPGIDAKLEFPQELEPLGMTALRLYAVNGGARPVRIDPRRIRGRTESGGAASALSAEGVRLKLSAIDPKIDEKILSSTTLEQGKEVKGFVFLPAGRYSSVVVKLVDVETGEADEFEIFL